MALPKYIYLREGASDFGRTETEDDAIKRCTETIASDSGRRSLTIYKAVKVVRPKESPVVVEDLPQ